MARTALVIALVLTPAFASAQPFGLELDHANILVSDLDRSAAFYSGVLQLKELETPWGPNPRVRFFSIGGPRQIHVVRADDGVPEPNKAVHVAFTTRDFDAYLDFLTAEGVEYTDFSGDAGETQVRPDGVRQVYFEDPDGNWIEVNDAGY